MDRLDLTAAEQDQLDTLFRELAEADAQHEQAVEGIAELTRQRDAAARRAHDLHHQLRGAAAVVARGHGFRGRGVRLRWLADEDCAVMERTA